MGTEWWIQRTGKASTSSGYGIRQAKRELVRVLQRVGATLDESNFEWQSIQCPFHDDKSPSAGVNLRLGRFNCFVCGINGDAVDVVQEYLRCDMKEAIAWIRDLTD